MSIGRAIRLALVVLAVGACTLGSADAYYLHDAQVNVEASALTAIGGPDLNRIGVDYIARSQSVGGPACAIPIPGCPEPSSLLLLMGGFFALLFIGRRRRVESAG